MRVIGAPDPPQSPEQQNREFFDLFLTRLVRDRFHAAVNQSSVRRMTVVAGVCSAARCKLSANGCTMLIVAARIASVEPELIVVLLRPCGSARGPIRRTLRYRQGRGWIDTRSGRPVGRLTHWLDRHIACFLRWARSSAVKI